LINKRRSGLALGTVLACLAALAVILFAAVSAALSHLNFSRASTNQEHARNLADAAIAEAIDRLVTSDYSFGTNGTDGVTVTIAGLSDAEGGLSFSNSGDFSGRHSFNNLGSDNQRVEGLARPVPGRTVHLVARGRVGNTVRWVECLYHRPPFPDGLLATGPIDAKALHLAGVRGAGDYTGGDISNIPLEDRMPGNLFSNSAQGFTSSGPSAAVSQNSIITGSMGSVGGATVDNSSVVQGEVLPGSETRPVPEIDVVQKIDLLAGNAIPLNNSYGSDLTLDPDWFSISSGDLQVNGDLELRGSALLVRGDLTVGRALTGTGLVLVDGDVQIGDGGSNVTAGNQVAIGCTGDFDLQAAAPENNFFKGVVYCEGDFWAKDITVVGATVVNGKRGAAGSAELENVRFVYNPGGVELIFQPPKGYEKTNHTLAVGFLIRPGDVEGEYVCDAQAYFGFGNAHGDNAPTVTPLAWAGTDSRNDPLPDPLDPLNPTNWYESFRDVPLGHPSDPNFGEVLIQQIGQWAEVQENRGEDRDDWLQEIRNLPGPPDSTNPTAFQEYLRNAIRQSDESQRVSFNLNNLFAESMGRSRVLYWRPVTER
jgi:hypothetical protein